MRNRPRIVKISPVLRPANRWSLRVALAAALLRQRRLPFLPYHDYLGAKGDRLSIATQELLLALQPSPPGLDHGTRPGIPAAAELAQGPGPEDVEHKAELGEEGEARTGLA